MDYFKEFEANLAFHFSEILNTPLARPYWVFISLLHRCNFNCQMCGVKKVLRDHELDPDVLKKALGEVAEWGSDCAVLLTGGEPFLRKDIFDIIAYSVSLGLKTEVVSNGSQIDGPQVTERIIDSGLANIAISLDGARPQTHDNIRGTPGAHRKALNALDSLCRLKKKKARGPQISAWVTTMNENVDELYDMIGLAEQIGVECLVYHPVVVTQDDMQNTLKSGNLWIKGENIARLKQQIGMIMDYQKQNGLVAFLHDPYLWLDYFQGTINKKDWKCNPFVFIDIGPDGSVRSCGHAFGNIKEMSLTGCLTTKEADLARKRMQACQKPCLQTCWARPEADNLLKITKNFISQINGCADKKQALSKGLELLDNYEDMIIKEHNNGK